MTEDVSGEDFDVLVVHFVTSLLAKAIEAAREIPDLKHRRKILKLLKNPHVQDMMKIMGTKGLMYGVQVQKEMNVPEMQSSSLIVSPYGKD